MIRIKALLTASLLLLFVTGCPPVPMQPGPVDPDANNNGDPARVEPGNYSGTVTSTVTVFIDGDEVEQTTDEFSVTEALDADLAPVLSNGRAAQVQDALVLADDGQNFLIGEITDMTAGNGRMTLDFALEGVVDEVAVTGTGQATYALNDDGSIDFSSFLSFSGTNQFSQTVHQEERQEGTLTR